MFRNLVFCFYLFLFSSSSAAPSGIAVMNEEEVANSEVVKSMQKKLSTYMKKLEERRAKFESQNEIEKNKLEAEKTKDSKAFQVKYQTWLKTVAEKERAMQSIVRKVEECAKKAMEKVWGKYQSILKVLSKKYNKSIFKSSALAVESGEQDVTKEVLKSLDSEIKEVSIDVPELN